jgi:ketosteroid isomerase-like protein
VELSDAATAEAAQIAERLKTAFENGPDAAQTELRALYGDTLELHHVPPLPSDGTVDGERMREASGQEAAAVKRAIPDQHYGNVEVVADKSRVHVKAWIQGTLTTGNSIRLLSEMWCTVRDGRIVAIEHIMDEEAMARWVEVAAAGGLKVPTSFLDESSQE